jgi:hypothetical protein
MRVGFATDAGAKPECPTRKVDIGTGTITELELYKHNEECRKLTVAVCKAEGKLVAALTQKLWGMAKLDPATARFLFKEYKHAHGIESAEAPAERGKPADGDDDGEPKETVQIVLPDNGRGPKT